MAHQSHTPSHHDLSPRSCVPSSRVLGNQRGSIKANRPARARHHARIHILHAREALLLAPSMPTRRSASAQQDAQPSRVVEATNMTRQLDRLEQILAEAESRRNAALV